MKFFVFDVESAGLHGPGFAVGYSVVDDESGMEIESDWRSAGIGSVKCTPEDRDWLSKNLPSEVLFPSQFNSEHSIGIQELHEWFKDVVSRHKDCAPASDCAYPVEANWLRECSLDPYPLHEIATALLLAGRDPVGTFERLPV